MEADFGALATWVYSTRYSGFKDKVECIDHLYPEELVTLNTQLLYPPVVRNYQREYIKNISNGTISGQDIKFMLGRNIGIYTVPAYLDGSLERKAFHDTEIGEYLPWTEDLIEVIGKTSLPDYTEIDYIHMKYNFRVTVSKEAILTEVPDVGWVRSHLGGLDYSYSGSSTFNDKAQLFAIAHTHMFISLWCNKVAGVPIEVPILGPSLHLTSFKGPESASYTWSKKEII